MQGASRESLAVLRDVLARQTPDATSATLQTLADQLFGVVSVLADQGSLRRAVADPGLSPTAKRQVVETLFASRLSTEALEVVRAVARTRWSAPVDVVDALEALAVETSLAGAEEDGQLDEVEDELFRFERILDGQQPLRSALTNRNLPAERKRDLVHRLLDGKAADVTIALVERAVLAPRGRTLERVLDEFISLAAQRRERLIARVTSAIPLTDDQQQRLGRALAREFGREIRLQLVVDPTIVGGVTVRVGDELLDDSVLRHLGTARRHLTGRSGGRARH